MTDIVRITADMVISRKKGEVKYYAADGSISTTKSKQVRVFDTQEELDADVANEQAAYDAEMAAGPEQAPDQGEQVSNDGQAGEDSAQAAAAAPSNKRGKGRKKEQMATKKKAAGKKAASKKGTKVASNGAVIRTVAGREHDISGYEKVKNASGHTSYDNGDDVAQKLRGKTLDEVYTHASKVLKEPEKDLRAKYKHLNPGMQRMSLGNRLRKVANDKAAA